MNGAMHCSLQCAMRCVMQYSNQCSAVCSNYPRYTHEAHAIRTSDYWGDYDMDLTFCRFRNRSAINRNSLHGYDGMSDSFTFVAHIFAISLLWWLLVKHVMDLIIHEFALFSSVQTISLLRTYLVLFSQGRS